MKKRLTVFLTMLILAMGMMPAGVFAEITKDSTASITVTNAVDGDKLAVYKIVASKYDPVSNTVSHEFTSAFSGYFTAKNVNTVEALAALDADALKETLAGLPKYISDNRIQKESSGAVSASGTVEFTGMPMGEYFIMPTSTTSVYQLMLQKVEPVVTDGNYSLPNVSFSAKHKSIGITKTSNKTSVTKGEKVKYTVEAEIPAYELSASSKTFEIKDTLDAGLTLDQESINVKFKNGAEITRGMYSINDISGTGFTLSVSNNQYTDTWKTQAQAGNSIIVEYAAAFDNSADTDSVVETFANKAGNNVEYSFSSYPYSGLKSTKTASVDVNSFIIQVDKCDSSAENKKLAGATFDLYKAEANGSVTIPHTDVKGTKMETLTTDGNGAAQFKKYEANGNNFDYYLIETKAPSGYNLLPNAVKVNFTEANVDQNTGIYTVKVTNSTGLQLPVTGDRGTLIMTIGGIMLMAAAVALLAAARRRKNG